MTAPEQPALVQRIDAALPQTQCMRCGFPDCVHYAQAIAAGEAAINQCPPGGQEGVERLARIIGAEPLPLNPANGVEGPLRVARIVEAQCIGCTLCIEACPVDCIVGVPKAMHGVIQPLCTGCELCLPACPVDCIALVAVSGERTGWSAWSSVQAEQARRRYAARRLRKAADEHAARPAQPEPETKRRAIDAAMARARARRPS